MKRNFFLSIGILLALLGHAQVPQQFAFQGVARDATNKPVVNQTVGVRFSIRQGSESGGIIYQETHAPMTTSGGVFNLSVGTGNVQLGAFTGIKWGQGSYFLHVELDATGSNNYTEICTTQLQSVPYALVSSKADNLTGVNDPENGDVLEFKDGTWIRKPKTRRYHFSGSGENAGPTFKILTEAATITIEKDNPTITLSATKTFGSSLSNGGEAIDLVLGYRRVGDVVGEYTPFKTTDQINNFRVPAKTRIPFTLSGSFQTTFKAGEVYEIGMLGKAVNGGSWNENGPSTGFIEVSY